MFLGSVQAVVVWGSGVVLRPGRGQGSAVVASARVLVLTAGGHGRRPAWRARWAQRGTVGAPWGLARDGAWCPDHARANVRGRVLVAGRGGVSKGCVSVPDSSAPRTARVGAPGTFEGEPLAGLVYGHGPQGRGRDSHPAGCSGAAAGRSRPTGPGGWPSAAGAGVGTGGRCGEGCGVWGRSPRGSGRGRGHRSGPAPAGRRGAGPGGCGAGQNGGSSVVVVGWRSGRLALTLRKPR